MKVPLEWADKSMEGEENGLGIGGEPDYIQTF